MIYNHAHSWKFFEWLRRDVFKIDKPRALPIKKYSEEDETWDDWYERIEAEHPIAFWITEDLPTLIDKVRNFFNEPFSNLRSYCYNRFNHKCHYLPTGLEPGKYFEVDTRILHGLFGTLVAFVESELAWMHAICHEDEFEPECDRSLFKQYRCKAAGLAHLEWEMTLTNKDFVKPGEPGYGEPTHQAIAAKEIYELYNWWTVVRPSRPDPWKGYMDFINEMKAKYPTTDKPRRLFENDRDWTLEERQKKHELYMSKAKIEQSYDIEDEEMMIRLIKARRSLWT